MSSNEPRVSRASSEHLYCCSDVYGPSAFSFQDHEYSCGIGCMLNDASKLGLPPSDIHSPSPENECVDSARSVPGDSTRTQQERSPGSGLLDNLPHSPLPDPARSFEEIPQLYSRAPVEDSPTISPVDTLSTGSPDNGTPRPHCGDCNVSFASKSSLTRHKDNRFYWVCTVPGCGKSNRRFRRKYNFKRHCEKQHPLTDLKQFGL